VLEMSMSQIPTFDMLWGYYYATGSEKVIRRMVHLFHYEDADYGEGLDIPAGYTPIFDELPEAARWALVSNAETHPQILKILEGYYQSAGTLEPVERKGVRTVLSELLPQKYPPKADPEAEAGADSQDADDGAR
jgi:hypothetical protein